MVPSFLLSSWWSSLAHHDPVSSEAEYRITALFNGSLLNTSVKILAGNRGHTQFKITNRLLRENPQIIRLGGT
jgi:hypothetical protein